MINVIWFLLFFSGFICYLINGNISGLNTELFQSSKDAFNLILELSPIMVMWMGFLNVAENGGLLKKFSILMQPFFHKLFPKLDKNDKALEYISSNIVANMMGLGSAATPFGLKAMQELQKNNQKKGKVKIISVFPDIKIPPYRTFIHHCPIWGASYQSKRQP